MVCVFVGILKLFAGGMIYTYRQHPVKKYRCQTVFFKTHTLLDYSGSDLGKHKSQCLSAGRLADVQLLYTRFTVVMKETDDAVPIYRWCQVGLQPMFCNFVQLKQFVLNM